MISRTLSGAIFLAVCIAGYGGIVTPLKAAGNDVTFTYSVHPEYKKPINLQKLFDEGGELLRKDDDGPGNGNTSDDVSLDVNFKLIEAASTTFPNQSALNYPEAQRYDFTLGRYNRLQNSVTKLQLRNATFAQIKLVETAKNMTGQARCTNNTMVLNGGAAKSSTTVHEWGHLTGIYGHRNDSTELIMYEHTNANRCEINTREKSAYEKYFQTGGKTCLVIDYTQSP